MPSMVDPLVVHLVAAVLGATRLGSALGFGEALGLLLLTGVDARIVTAVLRSLPATLTAVGLGRALHRRLGGRDFLRWAYAGLAVIAIRLAQSLARWSAVARIARYAQAPAHSTG
jgi:hypothetical protein